MASADYIRDLLGKAPVLAYAKDLAGRYLFVNETWLRFTGFRYENVVGKTDHELFAPEFADRFVNNDQKVVATGETVETEEHAPSWIGRRVGHSTKFPLRDESGVIVAVGGISVDITERYEAERALAASERRYRDLIEHSPEAFFVFDVTSERFVDANANTERLFGLTRAELLRSSPASLSPPLQPDGRLSSEASQAHIGAALAGESPVFDWIHRAGDGRLLPCRIWLSAIDLPTGRGVRASILDMREVERMRVTLDSTRAKLDAIQDALPQVVLVYDPERDSLVHCNRTYQQLGPSRPLWQVAARACEQALREGSSRQEVEVQDAEGRRILMDVDVSVFRAPGGDTPRSLLLVGTDITQQRRLDAELQNVRRLEGLGRLAGGVAHDFNNLLTVILGSASFLDAAVLNDASAQADLDVLRDAAGRAQQITAQLLTFARSRGGQPEALAIDRQVGASAGILQRLLGEDLTLELRLESPRMQVLMDRGEFEQILINIAANARDAVLAEGRVELMTRTIARDEAQGLGLDPTRPWLELSVRDTGAGISDDARDMAFEPFFTTKGPGAGTGLGLSTVYGIVDRAGGQVSIDRHPDGGTQVTVRLPSCGSEDELAKPGSAEAVRSGALRILLVEDDEAVRKVNSRVLSRAGHEVRGASSGGEALEVLRGEEVFDVVVTDIVMPLMSGFELAARAKETRPQLPFVFVSGYAEDALRARGLSRADMTLLQKPFSPRVLVEQVELAVAQSGSLSVALGS